MAKLFPDVLKPGAKGPAVNMLAFVLKFLNYDPDDKIILDGDFTPNGEIHKALRDFQENSELEVTGVVDTPTYEELQEDLGVDLRTLTVEMFSASVVAQESA